MEKVEAEKQSIEYGKTRSIRCGDATLYLTVNTVGGKLSSILVKADKMGSAQRGLLHVISVLVNELLEAGADWGPLSKRLMYHTFEPTEDAPSIVHRIVVSTTEILNDAK